jgi:hypothetical protein
MTQEEREAVEWVRAMKDTTRPGSDAERHAATAIRMLSRPAPRTKEIEVWHVEYVQRMNGAWCPEVELRFSPGMAEARANKLRELSVCACIRVTGPHKQEVPA